MSLAIQLIETVVCEGEGVQIKELLDKTRKKEIVEARQIIFTLAQEAGITQAIVSNRYNQRHSSVVHAKKKIYGLCDIYPKYKCKIEMYRILLGMGKKTSGQILIKLIHETEMDIYELDQKLINLKTIYYKLKSEQEIKN